MPGLQIQNCILVFLLDPFWALKVKAWILSVCSNFSVSVSQRPYQTVVSLSVWPDSLATEHQWVSSTGLALAWPLALKPLREIPYQSFLEKHSEQIDTDGRNQSSMDWLRQLLKPELTNIRSAVIFLWFFAIKSIRVHWNCIKVCYLCIIT